jgi:Uma2 family endonuclease
MGNYSSYESLALRWAEVCRDPILRDLPYKIELNAWGKIEMSPASNRHARLQGALATILQRELPQGEVLTECAIHTEIGVRVPDVAWASKAFLAKHGETTPYPNAPEICVEILSPSNSDAEISAKTAAYLRAGAEEVWHVYETVTVRYFDVSGERPASRYNLRVDLPAPLNR